MEEEEEEEEVGEEEEEEEGGGQPQVGRAASVGAPVAGLHGPS